MNTLNTQYITDINQAANVLTQNDIKLITFSQNISYDTSLAEMYFDEFLSNANGCHDVQKFDSYLVIYGEDVSRLDKHFNEDDIVYLSNDELNDLSYSLGLSYDIDDKDDLIDELLSLDHEDYYTKYYSETSYRDLEYSFSFSGFSQGDYYKVQTVGNVESWLNAEYLTNIFYASPISGSVDIYINGGLVNEISIYEFIKDEYAYFDKKEFIEQLTEYVKDLEYKDLLIEFMQDDLSNDLDYSH